MPAQVNGDQMPVEENISRKPRRYFGCVAAISMAVLSMGIVSNAAGGQTSQVLVQESSGAFSAEPIPNNAVITVPKTVLPSHVYVLNNREIVTEKPPGETDRLHDAAEVPSSDHETTSHYATIRAQCYSSLQPPDSGR